MYAFDRPVFCDTCLFPSNSDTHSISSVHFSYENYSKNDHTQLPRERPLALRGSMLPAHTVSFFKVVSSDDETNTPPKGRRNIKKVIVQMSPDVTRRICCRAAGVQIVWMRFSASVKFNREILVSVHRAFVVGIWANLGPASQRIWACWAYA